MPKKYVYYFGNGKAEGKAGMKSLLGGKGANLAEMTNIEELEFKFIGDDESIMFEQRTWKIENGDKDAPLHWESGFIIAYPDKSFELFDAQNSKRVEVMKSTIVDIEKTKLQLSFESKYFVNDERMVKTTRDYFVDENSLRFVMKMGTQKTEYQHHLEAVLVRKVS